jgi:hypothetical protein
MTASGGTDGISVEINYGAPSVKGRKIFGDLVPYNTIWRTGANENTTISFSSDVNIQGEKLAAGTYGLFTTPGPEVWKVHFNAENEEWGAYSYDASKDVLVVSVPAITAEKFQEQMAFIIKEGFVELRWADMVLPIPVVSAP